MDPDLQRLEDISSIRDAPRQISQEASVAVDLLDAKIEDERLDGRTEAEEVRTILELMQNLSLEVSEELDAYQERLRGANLTGARVSEEQLASCLDLEGATMPDGTKHSSAWDRLHD